MKKLLLGISVGILLYPAGARAQEAALKTDNQKTFYALGIALGSQVSQSLASLNLSPVELKFVAMGLQDSVRGAKPKVSMETFGPKISALAKARQAAALKQQAAQAEKEKAKSKEFLTKAAKEKGATTFPSGLIFVPIRPGSGDQPSPKDTVKVHYHGTLTDGTVFDSSVERGQPIEFPLDGVIACWTEGVQKIKKGGKAKLVCPSDIAYGDQGHPPQIPGGATLVFEVELLDIIKADAAKASTPIKIK